MVLMTRLTEHLLRHHPPDRCLLLIPSICCAKCEDALLEAVKMMEDKVALTLAMPQPPTAGMQQASAWQPLKRAAQLCFLSLSTTRTIHAGVSDAMLNIRGLALTVQDFDLQGEPQPKHVIFDVVECGEEGTHQ